MEPHELTERLGRWASGRGPLYLLLAARLRQLIDEAELPAGMRLPPDRALASTLAVGRSTVVAAYDVLRAEGRLWRRQGSGTRVAGDPRDPVHGTTSAPVFLHLMEPGDGAIMLACAAPDRPPPELTKALPRVQSVLAETTGDIGYHPSGYLDLRRAIADHYARRGAPTEPDRILVTNGAQHALALLARDLLRPGDDVVVEAPTYPGALEAFRDAAVVVRALPVGLGDLHTVITDRPPALAYVIPTFHNPTGAVLTTLPRRRLAEVSASAGIALIEDEVLADLAFPGVTAPPSMASYVDQVISIGSLSKIVWGGLRIGWIRAPADVVARLARLRAVQDLGGTVLSQLTAAELVPQLDAIRLRRGAELQSRHDHLRAELSRWLPEWDVPAVPGGQTLWVRLPRGDGTSFAQTALRHGVAVLPGNGLDASGRGEQHIRVHFVLTHDELTEGVQRLATAWRAYSPPRYRATGPPAFAV